MSIAPIDITHSRFKKKFRGFSPNEVHDLLDQVRVEMGNLRQENESLKDELKEALTKLAELKDQEILLRDALITVQRTSEDMQKNAEKEASLVVSEAEQRAATIVGDAHKKAQSVRQQIQDLRQAKLDMRSDLKAQLDRLNNWLEAEEASDQGDGVDDATVHVLEPEYARAQE